MLWAVALVPTPATTVARSPTASLTARRRSPVSRTLVEGLSPVVPLTTTPSWPCSTRWWAMAAVPSRSTAPSSVNAVAIAVSIRPKGAGDVMEVRLLRHAGPMVVLVPRQLRMTGMTGNVPYYGGRLSPAQAFAASHPAPPPGQPLSAPPPDG